MRTRAAPPPAGGGGARVALKSALEPFAAPDGTLYLIDATSRARFAVRDAAPWQVALVEQLHGGARSEDELASSLDAEPGQVADALDALAAAGVLAPDSGEGPLDEEVGERYARQLLYFADELGGGDAARAAQRRLAAATVAIVGCGGLGSWALAALACAGVGRLVLVDDDTVALSNLNRQLLFRRADVGRLKVEAAAEAVRAFAPELEVVPLCRRVASEADAHDVVAGADVVVETADWPPYLLTRWLDSACRRIGAAHISAAQQPPVLRVGPLRVPGRSPCLRCWEGEVRRRHPLYDAIAEGRLRRSRAAPTVGYAAAAVGGVLASEVVHHLTGVADPATLRSAWILDLRTLESRREEWDAPRCRCEL